MTNKIKTLLIGFAAVIFLLPVVVQASTVKSGDNVYLPKEETIDGNLYAASNNITIDGEIKGDLIAVAQTITVNGRLEGDLIAAAQTITVNGEVNGNIRVAGNSANLNGPVARNVNVIGNSVVIGKEAKIGWDLLTGAVNTNILGIVNGNVDGSSDSTTLSGKVGKNFNFSQNRKNQNITISPEASINGDVYYNEKTKLNIAEGANIAGKINPVKNKEASTKNQAISYLWSLFYAIFAALIIGLVLTTVGKKLTAQLNNILEEHFTLSLGWGLLVFLATPLAAIVLMFTIIGLPLALIMLACWLIMLWVGKIIAAIYLGKKITNKLEKDKSKNPNLIASLIIGVVIAWLLFSLPFLGWLISLFATCIGLGAFILYLRQSKN